MLKIINCECDGGNLIKMREMKPLQVGYVHEKGKDTILAMRTSSADVFEVMNLSNPRSGGCWSMRNGMTVRLLSPGEKVTIELSND